MALLMSTGAALGAAGGSAADFAAFDARAQKGEALSVVFFGGSLTWGANASDPQRTSYRALMGQYLRQHYPKSSFTFVDASIGGTGSMLGMFRLDRDVLSHDPDLVFLDFTLNDNLWGTEPQPLASYEIILRELIGRGVPVVQVFMTDRSQALPNADLSRLHRYEDHVKLAKAYGTGVGDVLQSLHQKVGSGAADPKVLWPFDGIHPDDPGYRLFFEAVRDGYESAVREKRVCSVPAKAVFSDDYATRQRIRLVDSPLPKGWERAKTYRTSLWFDGLSSRWMGDVAMCDAKHGDQIEPLRVEFSGTFVGVFGEADQNGMGFRATVDGKPLLFHPNKKLPPSEIFPFDTSRFGEGRLFIWRPLSEDLPPGKHVLEIMPEVPAPTTKEAQQTGGKKATRQLRIESICVAG
jgi:lysophospholipase L1-like esterase